MCTMRARDIYDVNTTMSVDQLGGYVGCEGMLDKSAAMKGGREYVWQ